MIVRVHLAELPTKSYHLCTPPFVQHVWEKLQGIRYRRNLINRVFTWHGPQLMSVEAVATMSPNAACLMLTLSRSTTRVRRQSAGRRLITGPVTNIHPGGAMETQNVQKEKISPHTSNSCGCMCSNLARIARVDQYYRLQCSHMNFIEVSRPSDGLEIPRSQRTSPDATCSSTGTTQSNLSLYSERAPCQGSTPLRTWCHRASCPVHPASTFSH